MQASVVLGDRRYVLTALETKEKADGSTNTYYAYVPAGVLTNPKTDMSKLGHAVRMGFPVKRVDELPEVAIFELPDQTIRVPLSRGMSPAVDKETGKAKRSYPQVKGSQSHEVKALEAKKSFNVTVSATQPGVWNIKVAVIGVSGGNRMAFDDDGEVVSSAALKKLASL